MNPIKDWFKKKKIEREFKTAGPGHRLDAPKNDPVVVSQPSISRHSGSVESQRAGAAALARLEKQNAAVDWSGQALKAQVRKELEKEQGQSKEIQVEGLFHCPLIGPEVLPEAEMRERIRDFLHEQLEGGEGGLIAALMIHTLTPPDKLECGVGTLVRYLENALTGEEKFRRIRLRNRLFEERVAPLPGALHLLQAAGFRRHTEGGEEVLIFDPSTPPQQVCALRDALLNGEPLRPELDRGVRVLRPHSADSDSFLPDSFFRLTVEDVRREQQARSAEVEQLTQLRTRAMRERGERGAVYRYTLVRVRFPDGLILQGTFSVGEGPAAVQRFVADHLADPGRPFRLLLPGGAALEEGPGLSALAPAALLAFQGEGGLCPETAALLEDSEISSG